MSSYHGTNARVETVVRPTSVRLYQRRDAVKRSHPVLQKTATDLPQRAFLVQLNSERWEMQVATDRDSPASGTGPGRVSPPRYGPGPGPVPGAQLVAAFDLKTIRSCVFRGNEWIEITDSSGQCIAVEFNKDDPGFLEFNQRLTTNLKLLKVKCSSTLATFDRAKWLPTTTSAARDLPPPPPDSSSARRQLPSREELDQHDYCDLVDDNNDRASTPNDWPTVPPPPPPSTKPRRRGWEIPQGDDRGRSINSSEPESISNSSNTTHYSNGRRSLSSNTSREDDYLLPVSQRLPRDANDTVKRTPPPPPPKPGPQMTKDTSGSSSSSTSGSEWHCSKCTYWNSSKQSLCEMCDNPRKVDADQCREYSRVPDFQSKDESSCPECRSVAASKSLDCSECRRLDRKASGCNDVRAASRTKTDDCEECNRVGNRAQVECKACRISAAIKSNSLDGAQHKRLDEARDDECVKCIAVMAILAPENPPPKTRKNTTAHSASSIPDSRCPVAVNVSNWRCQKCTLLNPANVFYCTACSSVRDDGWQCLVCTAVISSDLYRCETCDVWKCRLCTTQNDARENATRVCKMCSQFQ